MADYAISNVPRRVVYAPSGVGPYAFTFEILDQTDIAVYKASTLLTLTTDYTVTINANGTGSVTLVATAGTSNITIVGAKNIQRTTDFTTGGDLFANTLNDELDNQTIFIQQVAETAERGLKAPVVDPTDINMTLPAKASRVGTVLAFNATTGNPEAGPSIASVTTVAAQSANINTVATNIASVNTVAGNITNVNTVAGVSGNVTTVASNIANVNAVGADLLEATSEINTVAVDIANVNTVGNNIASVNTVAGEIGAGQDVTVVAANLSGADTIGTVATNIANVNATGTNIANVNAVGADLLEAVSEINTVATDITNVNTVGAAIAAVNTVAGISSNVSTVAGISANVTTVAGINSAVSTVATNNANVTTVATNIASVNTCATDIAQIITTANDLNEAVSEIEVCANNIANINTVGTNITNVNTVAGISANVTIAATNVADINNFADVYQGAKATDPTLRNDGSALQSGDLYFNTTDDVMKVREAGAWLAAFASLSGALIAANNLSDVTSTSSARTNLGLGTGDSPTFTGVVTGAGTVSAPAITTTGDTNTGIYFPAADTIAFTEGGTESMRIDSSGNLSIGTTSTYSIYTKLHVLNGIALAASSTDGGVVVGASTSGTELTYLSMGRTYNLANTGEIALATNTAKPILFGTNSAERMRITSTGRVCIGTTESTNILNAYQAESTTAASTSFWNGTFAGINLRNTSDTTNTLTGIGLYGGSSGSSISAIANVTESLALGALAFYTGGSGRSNQVPERMRITSAGDVGIGTGSPSGKLGIAFDNASMRIGYVNSTDRNINIRANTGYNASITFTEESVSDRWTLGTASGNASLIFSTGPSLAAGTERMRINSSGDVGIGVTVPNTKLNIDVNVGSYDNGITIDNRFNWGYGSSLTFRTIPSNGASLTNAARIEQFYEAANSFGLNFYTLGGGTFAERMRITAGGNLHFNSGYGSSAVAYGCRAWVNFNGTGTPAIRASGNVSSITDVTTGAFTVNFAASMPDTNYAVNVSASAGDGADAIAGMSDRVFNVGYVGVSARTYAAARIDPYEFFVTVFR